MRSIVPHFVRLMNMHRNVSWKKNTRSHCVALSSIESSKNHRKGRRSTFNFHLLKKEINCPSFAHRSQYITPIVSFCFQIFCITRTIPTRSNDYDSTTRTRNSRARIARACSSGNARWRGICGTSAAKSRDSSVHTATTVANGRRTYADISRESIRIAAFTFWTLS